VSRSAAPAPAYAAALQSALYGAALPYGYTLTVWGSGMIASSLRGSPSAWEATAFIAGALAAYGLLRWISRGAEPVVEASALGSDPHLVRAGAVQVAAVGAALAAADVLGRISSPAAWPATGFAATLLYLLATTIDLALRERSQRSQGGADHAGDA